MKASQQLFIHTERVQAARRVSYVLLSACLLCLLRLLFLLTLCSLFCGRSGERQARLCLSFCYFPLASPRSLFLLNEPGPRWGRPSAGTILSYYVDTWRAGEDASSARMRPLTFGRAGAFELRRVHVDLIAAAQGGFVGGGTRSRPSGSDECWQRWAALQRPLVLLSEPFLSNSTFFFTSSPSNGSPNKHIRKDFENEHSA